LLIGAATGILDGSSHTDKSRVRSKGLTASGGFTASEDVEMAQRELAVALNSFLAI